MQIARIILRVSDLEASTAFWSETVGLTMISESGPFLFLDGGGVQLVLNEAEASMADESVTEVVFESDDVKSAYGELASRGVPFEVKLRPVTSDGQRDLLAAHFRDPDGHLASLTGWVDKP